MCDTKECDTYHGQTFSTGECLSDVYHYVDYYYIGNDIPEDIECEDWYDVEDDCNLDDRELYDDLPF